MRSIALLCTVVLVTCAAGRKPAADLSECVQPWESAAQTLPDGQALFVHEWSPNDPRSALGDGLGPLFNGRSCVQCHSQGGLGGGGGDESNVQLVAGVGVQHKESIHPDHQRRARLRRRSIRSAPACRRCVSGFLLPVTERATPALFGAGLLDRVTEGDLLVAEALSGTRFPEVSGRIGRDEAGRPGRFGWKGQTSTLASFVEGACANELGLQTHGEEQPFDDAFPGGRGRGVDLEPADVEALVDFVAGLPAPRFVPTQGALRGRAAFEQIGCAACHVEDIGEVRGAYTDLLLHDMGRSLADRAVSTYRGVQVLTQGTASAAEWRTPPLWGVAHSGPWLHDGRAPTLDAAIRAHGGEALDIRLAYEALAVDDRAAILSFLSSLVAPNAEAPPVVALSRASL